MKNVNCDQCVNLLLSNDCLSNYHSLIYAKDKGGLLYPSNNVLKILKVCEVAFKIFISGTNFNEPQINSKVHIKQIMKTNIMNTIPDAFSSSLEHNFFHDYDSEI